MHLLLPHPTTGTPISCLWHVHAPRPEIAVLALSRIPSGRVNVFSSPCPLPTPCTCSGALPRPVFSVLALVSPPAPFLSSSFVLYSPHPPMDNMPSWFSLVFHTLSTTHIPPYSSLYPSVTFFRATLSTMPGDVLLDIITYIMLPLQFSHVYSFEVFEVGAFPTLLLTLFGTD
ncbi:unnamed protein product [Sphacelaria rigidula]